MTDPLASTAIDTARMLLDSGQPQQALRLLSPHLAAHPDDGNALELAAGAHLDLDNLAEAVRLVRAAIRADPDNDRAWRILAFSALACGDMTTAIDAIDRSRRLAPHDWTAHTNSASVYGDAGVELERAAEFAREGIALAPNEAAAHHALGRVLVGQKKWGPARASLHEALRLDPQNAPARHTLSYLELQSGGLGAAAVGFAEVLRLDPTQQTAVHNTKVTGTAMIRSFMVVVWPVFVIMCAILRPRGLVEVSPVVSWPALVLAPLLIFAIAGWRIRRVARDAGAGLLRVVRAAVELDRGLAVMFVMLTFAFATTLVAVPLGPSAGYGAYVVGLIGLIPANIMLWRKASKLRQ